jgi:hypothetical protein
MKPMSLNFLASLAIFTAWTPPLFAGPLKDAKINHAVNDVRVMDAANAEHPAVQQEVLPIGSYICSGLQSRAEVLFADQTLTRLGAETSVRINPHSRDLLLDHGTLLIQVPKFRGDTRVHTGSLTASVGSATFLIEHLPAKSVKIAVLDGELRIAVDGFLGDSIILTPGKMLITKPDVRRIPDPVDVDLRTLAKTSSLINPDIFRAEANNVSVAQLPSMPLIERKIAGQDKLVRSKTLFPTNLAIVGGGTNIVIPAKPGTETTGDPATGIAPPNSGNEKAVPKSANIALRNQPVAIPNEESSPSVP